MLGAAGITSTLAQNVYSVNVVGYINLDLPAGLSMVANQLDNGNGNLVTELLPAPAIGTTLFKYDGVTPYQQIQFLGVWLGATTMTLAPGEGVFMSVPAPATITFVGEVMQGTLVNPVVAGLDIYSSMVPQEGTLSTDLGFTAGIGDTVNQWNGPGAATPYTQSQFLGVWLPTEPTIGVGEAFWLSSQSTKDWTREFNVN